MGGAGGGKGPQPICYKYVFASEKDVMILNICIKSWLRGEWSKIFQATDDERIAIFEAKYFAGLANNTQGAFATNGHIDRIILVMQKILTYSII